MSGRHRRFSAFWAPPAVASRPRVPGADSQGSRAAGGCCCVHRWRCLQSWRKRTRGDDARAARGAIRSGTWKDRSFVVRRPDTDRIGSGAQGRWPGPARGWTDRRPLLGIRRAAHRFAAVPWVLPQLRPRRIPQDDAQIKRKSSGPLNGTATRLWSGAQDWRRPGILGWMSCGCVSPEKMT